MINGIFLYYFEIGLMNIYYSKDLFVYSIDFFKLEVIVLIGILKYNIL